MDHSKYFGIVFALNALFIAGFVQPLCADVIVQHFWDFEGSFQDKIGSAHGTAGAAVSTGTGHDGLTAFTNGQNVTNPTGYVDIDSTQLYQPNANAFSVSFWVNIPSSTANRGLFDFSGNGFDGIQALYRSATDDIAVRVDGTGTGSVSAVGAGMIDNAVWHLIVANYDPATGLQVHVDGAGVDGSSATSGSVLFNVDSYLGAFNVQATSTNNGLNGAFLDDLAIYDGLLTNNDIDDLFSGARTPIDFQAVPEPSLGLLGALSLIAFATRRAR